MKKRILSTFLTLALLLTLLPTAVMAEGGNTIYTDMNYKGAGNGSYSQPYASFETALEKANNGDTIVIKGKGFINVQTVEDAPFVINKAVTITGDGNLPCELYIRASGILLGADVTMRNVELNLANKYHNAIFVNGHSFTAENITRGSGSRAVHLFAGGLASKATIQTPAPGSAAALTLTNSTFGNIHAGGMNEGYAGDVRFSITSSTVGSIYGSGAKEAEFNRDNWFDTTEPPAPEVNAAYSVTGPVSITVDGASTAGGAYTVSVNGNGSNDTSLTINTAKESKKLNLAHLTGLTVNGGTAAIAEINSDAAVTLENNAAIDFSESTAKTVKSLSGGGKIILGKEDKLTITGAFDGTYTFETSGGVPGASGLAKYGHTYITAGINSAKVSFKPYSSQTGMNLKQSNNAWVTSAMPDNLPYVNSFSISDESRVVSQTYALINGTGGDTITADIGVNWRSLSVSASLADIPLKFKVSVVGGASYDAKTERIREDGDTAEKYIASVSELGMWIEMGDGDEPGKTGFIMVRKDTSNAEHAKNIEIGTYIFSVFAPDANGGEIQQGFTLIVTEENSGKTETSTAITSIAPAAFGDTLTLTATVTAGDQAITAPPLEWDVNGKALTGTSVTVSAENGFKLGSNELRAIYPGDTAYAVSVNTANVTVSKATDASIHGFRVPTGGTFDGTVHTGSQTNLTVQRDGVTLDSSPSVTVEYTQNNQRVSQPVFPGTYTVTLSAPEGETYEAISQQSAGSFTIRKAAPTVTAAAEDKGSGTVELTATVSGVGAYFPTGSVTLKLGTHEVLAVLNNGTASQTIENVTAGTHRYSASYTPANNDALYNGASSGEQSVTVSGGSTPVTPELKTLEISGVDTVTVPGTAEYAVTGKDQVGNNFDLNSVSRTWSIDKTPTGVSIDGGKLIVTDAAIAGTITIRVTVGSVSTTKAVTLTAGDKPASKTDVTDKINFPNGELTYNGKGQKYENATITGVSGGSLTYTYTPTCASATLDGGLPKTAGTYTVTAKYADDTSFGAKTATLTIKKATVTVTAKNQSIYVGGTVPSLTSPVEGTHYTVTGLAEGDKLNGKITLNYMNDTSTAPVEPDNTKAGTYHIVITDISVPDNNYEPIKTTNGTLTIQARPSGGSSSGGSGGGSSSDRDNSGSTGKVETTTKPNGTTVKTETKADGTKVQTTIAKDGSTSKTTTNPNGSSVTENKAADGSTGTVKTDKSGQTTAETQLSGKAIEDAKKNGEPVKAPVEVEAAGNTHRAPVVSIELPRNSGETKVEIPVSNVSSGTVAVLVHSDGTEEIIKDSIPTENGIQLTVNGGATVKIVDNSKDFIDTREHWSRDQVNFVAARELFQGVGDNQFGVGRPMTRGMVNTVLARLAGVDTTPAIGQSWYDKGIAWARENGVSDGSNPNGNVTREQLAAMLYRYAGSPTVSGTLSFTDTHEANLYAKDALLWAVQNGILNGYGDGRIGPKANAERAQVAAMMARFIQNAQ